MIYKVAVMIIAGSAIIVMISIIPPPANYSYYAGLILVFIWGYAFTRVRFIWATLAGQQNRSVLRPVPACPWWPFVFSQRTRVRVGDDGKVPVGHLRLAIDAPPRSGVVRSLRPDGDIYFLRSAPDPHALPAVLLHHPVF